MDCAKTGELIRKLRREKGMTQNALAQKLNITGNAVSKWERGMGCPDVSLVTELSAILGVDMGALLTGDSITMKKLYPEWNLQTRIPRQHGTLVHFCTRHGLMYQLI